MKMKVRMSQNEITAAVGCFLLLFGAAATNCLVYAELTEEEIDAKLFALPSLPKVHYSYTLLASGIMEGRENRRRYEYARITHALTMPGEWVTEEQFENCLYTCAKVNKLNPKISASLAAGFNVWHRRFPKDKPPTYRGVEYGEEIDYFVKRLNTLRLRLIQFNKKYDSNVELSALLLDSERFFYKKGDDLNNEAMRECLDVIHKRAVEIFPNVRLEWYGRGYDYVPYRNTWVRRREFTGKEIMTSLSCSLYQIVEQEAMRQTYRLTCKWADELGVNDVTPWVALGAGYYGPRRTWISDYEYPVEYSHQMGAELNIPVYSDQFEKYADYNRAKVIVFYPQPFNAKTPGWAKHFIAYARGAAEIKDLDDLKSKGESKL